MVKEELIFFGLDVVHFHEPMFSSFLKFSTAAHYIIIHIAKD